jgi:lipoate-protein ligase A
VDRITCRLFPFAVADGPQNMAADEALLHSALDGTASLRFYGWSPPTLSLGYFQPESIRHADPFLAALPFVRRPSGGDTLVHHHELTYALAIPSGSVWQSRAASWLGRMHGIIATALSNLGAKTVMFVAPFSGRPRGGAFAPSAPPRGRPLNEDTNDGPLCFHHFTHNDLIFDGVKIVGSAQRKRRGALLQHGAILCARSDHTPSLPGMRELTGLELDVAQIAEEVRREFVRQTGCTLIATDWTESERARIANLANSKYRLDEWNRKR